MFVYLNSVRRLTTSTIRQLVSRESLIFDVVKCPTENKTLLLPPVLLRGFKHSKWSKYILLITMENIHLEIFKSQERIRREKNVINIFLSGILFRSGYFLSLKTWIPDLCGNIRQGLIFYKIKIITLNILRKK